MAKNREKCNLATYRSMKAHPERLKAYEERNKERIRKRERRLELKRFGLTLEQYDAMLVGQGGACAICGDKPERRAHAVDHCHTTGKVRGILCSRCNLMLGYARDRVSVLMTAIQYLERQK